MKGVLNARNLSSGLNVLPNFYWKRDAPHDLFVFIPESLTKESCSGATKKGTMPPVLCVLEEKINILYNIHCWTNNFLFDKQALQICMYHEKNSNPCDNLMPRVSSRAL